MPLTSGTRIGPYEIISPLGAGGMGEVYRARDTNLNRPAAIKVLPADFAENAERVSRLRREAQVLAALNHPNVAAIYGLEGSGHTLALALEFVDGADLSQHIARGPVPVGEAINYARQLVDALDAAHEKSIVHRDLKPANVKITDEGVVKVLDFGLAKAYSGDGSVSSNPDLVHAPTVTVQGTEAGVILGTAAYMSPEQARGKQVDKRSDIWAFGVVLYEMLTGRLLFSGETLSDTLASVLTHDPDWRLLPPATPAGVRRLLAKCLERDPKKRLRDIGDARADLDDTTATPVSTAQRSRVSWLPWLLAAGAALVAAWAVLAPRMRPPSSEVLHLDIGLPADVEPVFSVSSTPFAIAPDGRSIAMVGARAGQRELFIRRFDRSDSTEVPGSVGANSVTFSPDSASVAFVQSSGSMVRVSLSDLQQQVITSAADLASGLSWSPAGIVFNRSGALWIVAPTGGAPRALTTLDAARKEVEHDHPLVLPGERLVLFTSLTTEPGGERIESVPIGGGRRTVVVERASTPVWSPTGHLLFARDGAVLAAPFDPEHPAQVTESVPVMMPGIVGGFLAAGDLGFRLSSAGTLLYLPSGFAANRVVSVGRDGSALTLALPPSQYEDPRVSPDGRRVLFNSVGSFVQVLDLARGSMSRLTAAAVATTFPVWSADGTRVVLRQFNMPMAIAADGIARALPGFGTSDLPGAPGPDPDSLIMLRVQPGTGADVFLMSLSGAFAPKSLIATSAYEGGPQLSPDAHWLVYQSNATGQPEIYVRRYPALDRSWQASDGGGVQPRWSRTGRELYYRASGHLYGVSFDPSGAEPVFGRPVALFPDDYDFGRGMSIANYDVTPDGRFLMLRREPGSGTLRAVVNWTDDLKRVLAAGGAH